MDKDRPYWRALRLCAILVAFFAGPALVFLIQGMGRGPVGFVEIDLRVRNSTNVEMFWNRFDQDPLKKKVSGGERTTLVFPIPTPLMDRLRIDPTERPGEDIEIRRISLRLHDGAKQDVPLETILNWTFVNTTNPIIQNDAIEFRSANADPYFYGSISLNLSLTNKVIWIVHSLAFSDNVLIQLLVLGTLAAFLVSLSISESLIFGLTMFVVYVALYWCPSLLFKILGPDHFNVSIAVSRAAKFGLSVQPTRISTIILAICTLAFGLMLRPFFKSTSASGQQFGTPTTIPSSGSSGYTGGVAVALPILLTVLLMPDLNAILEQRLAGKFTNGWDANNFITWAGFVARNKQPYLDFWYPYSGMWTFDMPLPFGPLLQLSHNLTLLTIFGFALYRLCGHARCSFVILMTVLVLHQAEILPKMDRYLISVVLVLSFVAADRGKESLRSGRVLFWAACAVALWIEPVQLIYAAPGVLLAMTVDEANFRPTKCASIAWRAIGDFGIPAVILTLFLIWMAGSVGLSAFWTNNLQNAVSAVYALSPPQIAVELTALGGITALGLIGPYVLLLIGTLFTGDRLRSPTSRLSLAIAGVGMVGILVCQKHLVRPLGAELLWPTVVGSLLLFELVRQRRRGRLILVTVAGTVLACCAVNTKVSASVRELVLTGFRRTALTYDVLVHRRHRLDEANQSAFSETHFAEFKEELDVVHRLKRIGNTSLFVLGDMPIFYLFSEGPTPFQINTYNGSSAGAQERTKEWLQRVNPEVIVVDPRYFEFDDVQISVRSPIVINEIVKNYVPFDSIGRFHLLRRRRSDAPFSMVFWREVLGTKVDFGNVLQNIDVDESDRCAASRRCVRYLRLDLSSDVAGSGQVSVSIEVGPYSFEVSFMKGAGKQFYLLPIDRLWFWALGERMGFAPRVHTKTGITSEETVVTVLRKSPTLY